MEFGRCPPARPTMANEIDDDVWIEREGRVASSLLAVPRVPFEQQRIFVFFCFFFVKKKKMARGRAGEPIWGYSPLPKK